MSDSDLFQRLSLDETLGRTFLVYKTGFAVFTKIAVLTVVITSILQALNLWMLNVDNGVDSWVYKHAGLAVVLSAIDTVLTIFVTAVGNIMLIRAVADVYLDRPANLQASFKVGAQRMCTIFGASLIAGLAIALGFVLFLAPGIYLSVKWFALTPAIVIEGKGVTGSLNRSWELTNGSWCYVFCTQLIFSIVVIVLAYVPVFFVTYNAAMKGEQVGGFTQFLLNIPAILWQPLVAIAMTIMYINLRIEKESLNYDLFARDLGHACGDAAYTNLVDNEEFKDEDVEIGVQ